MTRALGQVPAAAKDHIAANLLTHLNADQQRITEAEADTAAAAVVLALRADGWHITAPPRPRP
ncbi:hypothetical protein [Streptomyces niveus]|uniref:hypothetical protein n=1 Tax=Streptomyces niveus TaxID=193462 RepID=UPI0036B979EA